MERREGGTKGYWLLGYWNGDKLKREYIGERGEGGRIGTMYYTSKFLRKPW